MVMFAAFAYKGMDKIDILPSFLDNGKLSYLDGRNLQTLPKISLDGFKEGVLQEEMEQYLSDCFPARDSALLLNAASQRTFIQVANMPFNFDVYPTFFGASVVYMPSKEILSYVPLKRNTKTISSLEGLTEKIANTTLLNNDSKLLLYIPNHLLASPLNPVLKHTSNTFTLDDVKTLMLPILNEKADLLIDDSDESLTQWKEFYFSKDHHWQISGAYRAYCEIAKELELEPLVYTDTLSFSQYPFYGALGRRGLFLKSGDYIKDYVFELPDYVTTRDAKTPFTRSNKKAMIDGKVDMNQVKYGAYSYYYGADYDRIIYEVEENKGKENLLIIGDSFKQPIEPMLATSYHKTYVVDPRRFDLDLQKFIEEYQVTDVVIIANLNSFFEFRIL
jgi:hypothetical protein